MAGLLRARAVVAGLAWTGALAGIGTSTGCAEPDPAQCARMVEDAIVTLQAVPAIERSARLEDDVDSGCRSTDFYVLGQAELLAHAERYDEARDMLIRIGPGSPVLDRALAMRFMLAVEVRQPGAGSLAAARAIADHYSRHFPQDIRAPLFTGIVAARSGDSATAVRLLDQAKAMAGQGEQPVIDLWEVHFVGPLFDLDRHADVVRIIRKQAVADPSFWKRADFVLLGVFSLVVEGQRDEAARLFAHLLEVNPQTRDSAAFPQAEAVLAASKDGQP